MPTPTLWRPSFRLNTNTNAAQDSAAVTGLSDGRFVAVWLDQDGGNTATIKYAIFNADGSVAKSEAVANQSTAGVISAGDVAVAALADGGFAITWSSRQNFQNDVFHRVFNGSGVPVSGDLLSNPASADPGDDQRHPDIASDGAGGFYVVWEDTSGAPNVQLRHFDSSGQPVGSATGLSDLVGGDEVPSIAVNRAGTQYAVVWDDDLGHTQGGNEDGIYGSISGGPGFRIDSGPNEHFHSAPDVAYSTDSNYMAVWSKFVAAPGGGHYHVSGAINGGGEFQVNTSPHVHSDTMPGVVGLQSGNFLVVWNDGGFDGGEDVLAQLFAVDGTKIGSEFVVSDFSVANIARIEASELLDGRVLVTWDANKLNQTVGTDVIARIVDPRQGASNWLGTNADEQYVGTSFADVLNGSAGNDSLWGEGAGDLMTGGIGNDTLNGGAAADAMLGGAGNDTYYVDNAGDIVDESVAGSAGVDTVQSANLSLNLGDAAHFKGGVENATLLGAAAISTTGNALANTLTGNASANTLDGGAGADTLRGLAGNDIYVIDNAGDTVDESVAGSAGTDTVRSSTISINLGDTVHYKGAIENIQLLGSTALGAAGNAFANIIDGSSNTAANLLRGVAGNDIYTIGAGDIVDESFAGSAGTDTVRSSAISINLGDAAHYMGTLENIQLLGSIALGAAGNGFANIIDGSSNTAGNLMRGLAGNDIYVVGAGDVADESVAGSSGTDTVQSSLISINISDTTFFKGAVENIALLGSANLNAIGNANANVIVGNAGANIINGWLGKDIEAGGAGNDSFGFSAASHSGIGVNADLITDFDDSGDDRIDLAAVFGGVLSYIGTAAFSAAGQVSVSASGADVFVHVNVAGTLASDMDIRLMNTTLASMAASDFVL